jgi:hypothetical protein
MSKCFNGSGGYDKIEGQGFAGGNNAATSSYSIDAPTGYQDTGNMNMQDVQGFAPATDMRAPGGNPLPSIQPSSEYPPGAQASGNAGNHMMISTPNIFAGCCPGSSGLTANCVLMVVFCAAEVGASMSVGSLLLLADFYRRLSCVFLLIHDMESEQLSEDYAGSNVNVLEVSQRGSNLAKAFVGIYLMSASFFMATASLWRMYGHNPPLMDESGYLILLGAMGLALDVLHVFCGVRQTIVHEDQSLSRPLWCAAQAYGSGLVMMEGLIDSANPGKYLDPIMTIGFVAVMCICNMNATLSASSELYNRGRG